MRRKEKEISETKEIEDILKRSQICRIGMIDGEEPYVVPVLFAYKDNTVYVHSAADGRKLDIIRKNPNVCFETETDVEILPAEKACGFSFKYKSVIGNGTAVIETDTEQKKNALNLIMEKCTGRGSWEYSEQALERICVIRIEINSITGKQSGF